MKILFIGDSITDFGRKYDNDDEVGAGYVHLIKASLGYGEPGKYEFINRGISGNWIAQVYARIKKDIINHKPDVLSILIGINCTWHGDAKKYFTIYDMLISEVKEALPNVKIMIMEPFALETGDALKYRDTIIEGRGPRSKKAREIAQKYNLTFVPLQEGFEELAKTEDASYWLYDGIHPTPMGHEYIKREWIKAFKKEINP